MTQQRSVLQRSFRIVRRYRILVGSLTAAGLLLAVAYSVIMPPLRASTALIVLPQNTSHVDTQVVIATSDRVLSGALSAMHSNMTEQTLAGMVSAKSLTSGVISVTALAPTGTEAQSIANAVARSYIAYVSAPQSAVGHIGAQLLQPASTSSSSGLLLPDLTNALVGLLAGAAVGSGAALVRAGRDRRLRELDDIASTIGVPVLAAVESENPPDATSWTRLLGSYAPSAVNGWRLHQALMALGVIDVRGECATVGCLAITVLSVSADTAALALGPQIAAFTASRGIATTLVVGPQHGTDATAALRTACGAPEAPASPSVVRPRHPRTLVADDPHVTLPPGTRLAVIVVTVDAEMPELVGTAPTDVTVLGVSAGSVTAEQLASVAAAAAADGREISGILVADPDSADRTTGRVPRQDRPVRRVPRSPAPRSSVPTEIGR